MQTEGSWSIPALYLPWVSRNDGSFDFLHIWGGYLRSRMQQRLSRETNHRTACLVSGSAPETAPPHVRNVQYARGAGDGPVATLTSCDTALNLAAAAGQNSPGENSIQLERECQSYTRYLIGQAPPVT